MFRGDVDMNYQEINRLGGPESTDDGWGGIEKFISLIRGGWKLIFVTTLLIGGISSIYLFSLPDLFTSETKILVDKVDKNNNKQHADLILPSLAAEEDYFGTQIALLTSGKALSEVVRRLGLSADTKVQIQNDEQVLGLFQNIGKSSWRYSVEAKRKRQSRVIELTVNGPDSQLAASIANEFAKVYVENNVDDNLFVSRQMLKWLDGEGETANIDAFGNPVALNVSREESINSLSAVSNDPVVHKLREDKLTILNQLRSLSQRYKPKHPEIRELSMSLDKVNQEIDARINSIVRNLKASLEGEMQISNVRILDSALPALEPSDPNRLAGVLISVLFGFFGSVLFLMYREHADHSLKGQEELPDTLRSTYLGSIPLVKELIGKAEHLSKNGHTYSDLLSKNLYLKDAIVGVRTHILFSMPFEKARKIMITSSIHGEGKSTVAILLALSLSEMGRKIILIDTDLRQPRLNDNLGVKIGPGLVEYLSGNVEMSGVVQSVAGTNLHVITGGSPTTESSALLASTRFDSLMEAVSAKYDRVIINVPPVLKNPDALIIAKHISCGLLVCAEKKVKHEEVVSACHKFEMMDKPLIGVVLNLHEEPSVRSGNGRSGTPRRSVSENGGLGMKSDIPTQFGAKGPLVAVPLSRRN